MTYTVWCGGLTCKCGDKILIGFCGGALTWLAGCGGSPHASTEKYYLVATNIKIPYWQSANAGLMRAAQQMGVKAEMVGPDTFDPKAEHDAFQHVLAREDQAGGHYGFGRRIPP